MGAEPRPPGTEAAPPPGCAQGTGWGGGPESGGRARRDSSREMPGLGSRDAPMDPQEPRVFPLPPTLRERHGARAGCRGRTYLGGGQLREHGEQQAAEQGAHGARGAARRGRPHRPGRAAREAAAARAHGAVTEGRGPGAGALRHAAPSRALGAGSAAQGGGGGRRSQAGGRPVVAADGGGGGGRARAGRRLM